jgi:uncharacterized protein (UPF0261 family)
LIFPPRAAIPAPTFRPIKSRPFIRAAQQVSLPEIAVRPVAGMTEAFRRWIERQTGIAGILSAGGSGGTALVAPAMRALPIGIPKLIVSTIASGDVRAYVGATDITMMHSVADVQGLNVITEDILDAAQAMIGMVQARRAAKPRSRSAPPSPFPCLV